MKLCRAEVLATKGMDFAGASVSADLDAVRCVVPIHLVMIRQCDERVVEPDRLSYAEIVDRMLCAVIWYWLAYQLQTKDIADYLMSQTHREEGAAVVKQLYRRCRHAGDLRIVQFAWVAGGGTKDD